VTNGGYYTFQFSIAQPPPPKCACGCGATPAMRFNDDGSLWAQACGEREKRRRAIANAEDWLTAAFMAVGPEVRARLYRSLAAAFHPDVGGDPALMVALNAVRARYP
jgi:hypothetical protein